jgi:hypothetical protein
MDPINFLIHLIIWVAVVGLLVYVLRLVISYLEVPEPFPKIIWVIVFIVLLIAILRLLGGIGGGRVMLFGP